jgi:hypothetical protein
MEATVKIILLWDMTQCKRAKIFTKRMERLSEYSLFYNENDSIGFLLIIPKYLPNYIE